MARVSPAPAAAVAGCVGDDAAGGAAEPRSCGARALDARLSRAPGVGTGTCVVLVAPDGERSMLPDAGANDRLAPGALADALVVAGDHLHMAGYALLRRGPGKAALPRSSGRPPPG